MSQQSPDSSPTPASDDVVAQVDDEVAEALRESQPGDLAANPPTAGTGTAVGRTVARASTVMAAGTVVSRVTGVLRDITMTAALGFFLVSDAYSLGNSLPTVVYILVIGGALNAVFIPQLVRRMKDDPDGGRAYADRLITLVATILLVLSVVAVVAAPWIVRLYTTSQFPPGEYDLAVAFARLCLPQVFFYGLYTLLSQVLNARGRFGMPMFAPIANNVIAIATFLLFITVVGTSAAATGSLSSGAVLLLGIGTTLGVIAQAVILIPVLWKSGYAWRPRFDWRGAGLGRAGTLATWTIGLVLVNQAVYIVITRLATLANVNASAAGVAAAGLTTYQKAHLVFLLPHSVITVSVVTALLPALSRVAHDGNLRQVGADLSRTMRIVAALIVPIAMVFIVNGASIAILLFGYGAATPDQAGLMGLIVSVFMIGLLPFTLFYVLLRGYYALEDTRTPFFLTVAFSVVLLVLVFPLFARAGDGGRQVASIALAYSLSYWVGFIVTWIVLARRLGSMDSRATTGALARIIGAGLLSLAAMAGTLVGLLHLLDGYHPDHKPQLLLLVIVTTAVGLAVYLAAAWILRIDEVRMAVRGGPRMLRRAVP